MRWLYLVTALSTPTLAFAGRGGTGGGSGEGLWLILGVPVVCVVSWALMKPQQAIDFMWALFDLIRGKLK